MAESFSLGTATLQTQIDLSGLGKGLSEAESMTKGSLEAVASGGMGIFGGILSVGIGNLISGAISSLTSSVSGMFGMMIDEAQSAERTQAQLGAVISIYGSPWTPWFFDWAFNLRRGPELRAQWDRIPRGTNILVTHGPPRGYGDTNQRNASVGCADLLAVVKRVRPSVHIFGHIHTDAGVSENAYTTFINASVCDDTNRVRHPPVVYDYPTP